MKTENGFTIVEVLVSVGIMLVFLPFAGSMLTNSQLLASYSKHKIEAAYAAEQLIETERQNPFLVIAPGVTVTLPPNPAYIVLDTKGNYTNVNCATNPNLFCGNAVITATPAVYAGTSGALQPASTSVDHFVVTITWTESILNLQVPMTETYAEDIANDNHQVLN